MTTPLTSEQHQRISEAIFAGRTIEAIKLYREYTGCGLAEAKQFIDAVTAELRARQPEKFNQAKASKGCLSLLLCVLVPLAVAGGIGLARWFS